MSTDLVPTQDEAGFSTASDGLLAGSFLQFPGE
jgi:hypothetical protein